MLHAVDHARLTDVAAQIWVKVRIADVADDARNRAAIGRHTCAFGRVRHGDELVKPPCLVDRITWQELGHGERKAALIVCVHKRAGEQDAVGSTPEDPERDGLVIR
eukprot:355426-Chlamydomonas_euryale.AAC.3